MRGNTNAAINNAQGIAVNDNFHIVDETQNSTDMQSFADAIAVMQPRINNLNLVASSWQQRSWDSAKNIGVYIQDITIPNSTDLTKVDLQPSSEVIRQLIVDKATALYIENDNGLRACLVGKQALTSNISVQYTANEVIR